MPQAVAVLPDACHGNSTASQQQVNSYTGASSAWLSRLSMSTALCNPSLSCLPVCQGPLQHHNLRNIVAEADPCGSRVPGSQHSCISGPRGRHLHLPQRHPSPTTKPAGSVTPPLATYAARFCVTHARAWGAGERMPPKPRAVRHAWCTWHTLAGATSRASYLCRSP
jgi:hypothetical protein